MAEVKYLGMTITNQKYIHESWRGLLDYDTVSESHSISIFSVNPHCLLTIQFRTKDWNIQNHNTICFYIGLKLQPWHPTENKNKYS
jgi:hypothetical protein